MGQVTVGPTRGWRWWRSVARVTASLYVAPGLHQLQRSLGSTTGHCLAMLGQGSSAAAAAASAPDMGALALAKYQ